MSNGYTGWYMTCGLSNQHYLQCCLYLPQKGWYMMNGHHCRHLDRNQQINASYTKLTEV